MECSGAPRKGNSMPPPGTIYINKNRDLNRGRVAPSRNAMLLGVEWVPATHCSMPEGIKEKFISE